MNKKVLSKRVLVVGWPPLDEKMFVAKIGLSCNPRY
jgi:hypothetical protein